MDESTAFEHRTSSNSTTGASDTYAVQYHGFTATHMDALCHVFWNGKMYNGFSQKAVTANGAEKLAVNRARDGIFTCGVLIDLAALDCKPYRCPL